MSNDQPPLETRMVFPVFPGSTNHYDTLFGGQAMAWMDQAAFICATRWCRQKVVTAHIGAIDFHHPIPVGSIVEVIAQMVKVGRTSMTIQVDLWIEPMNRPERTLACQGNFVMVAVDHQNHPLPTLETGIKPAKSASESRKCEADTPNTINHEPLYNIGAVSQKVNIPVATLRVWERRYEFLHAYRTPKGHRLYTEKDITDLMWVKNRIDEGMRTQQAIHAFHKMQATINYEEQ